MTVKGGRAWFRPSAGGKVLMVRGERRVRHRGGRGEAYSRPDRTSTRTRGAVYLVGEKEKKRQGSGSVSGKPRGSSASGQKEEGTVSLTSGGLSNYSKGGPRWNGRKECGEAAVPKQRGNPQPAKSRLPSSKGGWRTRPRYRRRMALLPQFTV